LSDAIDCRIQDNRFLETKEGIVFESDLSGKKETVRHFSADLLPLTTISAADANMLFAKSELLVKDRVNRRGLISSSYFRIAKCERTLISGNLFECERLGIEWSGTKDIVDFRIRGNAFIGCEEMAIQIEPDDRIFFVAEEVDTKVRLIEKNRFQVYAGAVRATIGAVRVEKNDIRIQAPKLNFIPWTGAIANFADNVYKMDTLKTAVATADIPIMHMVAAEAFSGVKKAPEKVDTVALASGLTNAMLVNYNPTTAVSSAKTSFVAKTLADIAAIDYIIPSINAILVKAKNSLEGYAINLTGNQNRAVHNHIFSDNANLHGGIVFHLLSGEVRDNEIAVPRIALMLNGKTANGSSARQNAEITGNMLKVTGLQAAAGTSTPSYAMAIPTLNPGHISITTNYFEGSVMIGGDPNTALKLKTTDTLTMKTATEFVMYNALKFDTPVYYNFIASNLTAKPKAPLDAGVIATFVGLLWLTDPHGKRPVVHFADNRVVRGWLSISRMKAGAHLVQAELKNQASSALVANLSNNIIDYQVSLVGQDLILVGNHSQFGIRYRAGGTLKQAANIPDPQLLS
jgi:hypothetical protein